MRFDASVVMALGAPKPRWPLRSAASDTSPALEPLRSMPRLLSILVLISLAGCGIEVASTATTAAKLQAAQSEQAKAQEAQMKKRLGEAMKAAESAASAAATP